MEKKDLSIIIPAYREENRILTALKSIDEHFFHSNLKYEVIVVEDGIIDQTGAIVKEFAKKNPAIRLVSYKSNLGKGSAVRKGMQESKGKLVLFTDADMATPIGEVEKFFSYFEEGYETVIASRRIKGAKIRVYQKPLRRFLGWLFHTIRRLIILRELKDTQCGFKCFTLEAAKKIAEKSELDGFVFDVEILSIAKGLGYKIKEIPVMWIDGAKTTLSVRKHFFGILKELLKVKWRSLRGKYRV